MSTTDHEHDPIDGTGPDETGLDDVDQVDGTDVDQVDGTDVDEPSDEVGGSDMDERSGEVGGSDMDEPSDEVDEPDVDEPSGDRDGSRPRRPRRRGRAAWVAVPVAAVLVLLIVVLATREPATDRVAKSTRLGKPAPAVSGRTLDGGTYDLGDRQGRWVVVNFFATWCPPCVKEHPELRAFAAEHAELGDAEVVSVVFHDDPSKVEAFFEENGGDWPVIVDEKAEIGIDYGVTGVPESYLVDPNGIVRVKLIGGVTRGGLDDQLDAAGGGS